MLRAAPGVRHPKVDLTPQHQRRHPHNVAAALRSPFAPPSPHPHLSYHPPSTAARLPAPAQAPYIRPAPCTPHLCTMSNKTRSTAPPRDPCNPLPLSLTRLKPRLHSSDPQDRLHHAGRCHVQGSGGGQPLPLHGALPLPHRGVQGGSAAPAGAAPAVACTLWVCMADKR